METEKKPQRPHLFEPASPFCPTKEQLKIQTARNKVVLIEANAGAAKTTTLAFRVGESLARGVRPEDILVLTFTEEAKAVMQQRLKRIGIPQSVAKRICVESFDEFSAGVLRSVEGGRPEFLQSPRELKPHVLRAIGEAYDAFHESHPDLEFADHPIAMARFIATQRAIKARMLPAHDFDGVSLDEIADLTKIPPVDWLVFKRYEWLRSPSGEAIFRGAFDATYDLAMRLVEDPDLPSQIKPYSAVLCDEMHDLNEAAFRVLAALISKEETYFVGAGDRDQVIHGSLGADSQFLERRFEELAPSLVRLPLTATYRFGPELAAAIGRFAAKKCVSASGTVTHLSLVTYGDEPQPHCEDAVLAAIDANPKKTQTAILLRERHHSIAVESALIARGLPYATLNMRRFLSRDEILFLRGLIAIGLNDLGMVESLDVRKAIIRALVLFCELSLTPTNDHPDPLEHMEEYLCVHLYPIQDFFRHRILREAEVRHKVAAAVEYLGSLPDGATAGEALREACRRLDLKALAKRIYLDDFDAAVTQHSIEEFIDLAARRGESIQTFARWVGQAELAGLRSPGSSPMVIVDCIASAKGMEFDHVIIPYLGEGKFPDAGQKSHENNIFYVGATRAKQRLTLVAPAERRRQSTFLARMEIDEGARDAVLVFDSIEEFRKRIDLKVPFQEKDLAKGLGARWDATRKVWYLEAGVDPAPFRRWIL